MKRTLLIFTALTLVTTALPTLAHAQVPAKTQAANPAAADIHALQEEWAHIKYQVQGKDAKLAAIAKLEVEADKVAGKYPDNAEAKIWQAIILATDANITKSLSGLPKVEKAKALLEESAKMDPKAMGGFAYTVLGSLYYQVPGWPVGFGSDSLAEKNFKQALSIYADGMDTNYWYGEFLLHDDRPAEAIPYLKKAASVPVNPNRKVADEGRLQETKAALAKAEASVKAKQKGNE